MSDADALLQLHRFCGRETYPIRTARWSLYDTEVEWGEARNLCLVVDAGPGLELHDDTAELRAEPTWELNLVEVSLPRAALQPGAVFTITEGYDDSRDGHLTNFYYCEHETTEANRIEVLEVDGDRLRLRLTGQATDVNYYDGSKPPNTLTVECWFEHHPTLRRSMS